MKKIFTAILGITLMLLPMSAAYALSSEVNVTKDGKASVSNAKVMQIAGTTFFTRLYWGDAFVRLTIKTNSGTTKFLRATGEATTIAEIKEGDLLDVSGGLENGSNTLSLVASSIRNSSVQKEQSVISGTVTGIDLSLRNFTLSNKERGIVTANIATTTKFYKGTRTLDLEHLRIGDRITKTAGDYDIPSKTLSAESVTTYIDLNTFKQKVYTGKLTETPSATEAATIKVSINKSLYTVFLTNKTLVMRNNKSTTTLQRFVAGDAIRLYGAIREVDEPIIDAEVVRNMSL